jgi:DeoR family suf operon transcriptional repressor
MKSTREKIVKKLLINPRSTIISLADSVGINGISVRHHLTSLQAEGLVSAEEERHGVGRPRLVYSLTELGIEKFPSNYLKLTNRLIDQIKLVVSKQQFDSIFSHLAENLSRDHIDEVSSIPFEAKLNKVKNILATEGFIIEWAKTNEQYKIRMVNCPYYHVGLTHPEVCKIDQAIISTLISKPLIIKECILSGDDCCSYLIDLN